MKHYDLGHDPELDWIETAKNTAATAEDVKQGLIAAQTSAAPGAVGDLTFAALLIDKLEEMHNADPDADVSLSVDGAWTAKVESVVVEESDDVGDVAA